MCDKCDDLLDGARDPYGLVTMVGVDRAITRRQALKLGVGTAATAILIPLTTRGGSAGAAPAVRTLTLGPGAVPGDQLVTMAMHVHSSFSERTGSMEGQLGEAVANGVDQLWWTEHDWRMASLCYRTQVSFDSLVAEDQFGMPWYWTPTRSGGSAVTSGGIVTSPVSPGDPSPVGALKVALSRTSGVAPGAAFGYWADTTPSRFNHQGNIAGLVITVDIDPSTVVGTGYLEVLMGLSHHQARNGRPAGVYSISYRFGIDGQKVVGNSKAGTRTTRGNLGVVTAVLPADTYSTVTLNPAADFALLWPDTDARDNAFSSLYLRACVCSTGQVVGYFDNLTLSHPSLATEQGTQAALVTAYQPNYPSVRQSISSEVSFFNPHLNTYGVSTPMVYPTVSLLSPSPDAAWFTKYTTSVRNAGGLTSFNHMYGTTSVPVPDPSKIPAIQAAMIAKVLAIGAYGVDIIEAGYRERGGMPLEAHLAVWDACSRNGIVTTANGVNDDHYGVPSSWDTQPNRFLTMAWAASAAEADLLTALAIGRVFVADQTGYAGTIDLVLDDGTPMGGITTRGSATSRALTILASALASTMSFEVVMGVVDFAGPSDPTSGTTVVDVVPAALLATGSTTITVPTVADCFYRLNLVDAAAPADAQRIGFTNPIWIVNAPVSTAHPGRQPTPSATTVTVSPATQVIAVATSAQFGVSVTDAGGAVPPGTLATSLVDSSGHQVGSQQFPAGTATYVSPALATAGTYTFTVGFTPTFAALDRPSTASATVTVSG